MMNSVHLQALHGRFCGRSLGVLRATAIFVLVALLGGCAGYVPGRQSYWDEKVKEMCAKDGGTTIYESIDLSTQEYERMGGIEGRISLVDEKKASPAHPYFRRQEYTNVNENPEVVRLETSAIRRSDGKILGKTIEYWRRGGDIPTGLAHESSFGCPEKTDLVGAIFRVKGNPK